jgi:glutamate 5-kinase
MNQLNASWQTAVIKVGSALISPQGKSCSTRYLLSLVDFIHHSHQQNKQIIIVSSGSVAAGKGLLKHDVTEILSIPQKQAFAAIGQTNIMQHWQKLFDLPCAQVLLTRSDLESESRSLHIKNTLNTLIEMNSVPIINENDSVAIDELVVGDNDNLAAKVAVLCEVDLLVICSDVNGLYQSNPNKNSSAKFVELVKNISPKIMRYAEATDNPLATGGMLTKLQAAKIATQQGIETIIVNGKETVTFENLKRNVCAGTLFKCDNLTTDNTLRFESETRNEYIA